MSIGSCAGALRRPRLRSHGRATQRSEQFVEVRNRAAACERRFDALAVGEPLADAARQELVELQVHAPHATQEAVVRGSRLALPHREVSQRSPFDKRQRGEKR
jgi:hypothetical protein